MSDTNAPFALPPVRTSATNDSCWGDPVTDTKEVQIPYGCAYYSHSVLEISGNAYHHHEDGVIRDVHGVIITVWLKSVAETKGTFGARCWDLCELTVMVVRK